MVDGALPCYLPYLVVLCALYFLGFSSAVFCGSFLAFYYPFFVKYWSCAMYYVWMYLLAYVLKIGCSFQAYVDHSIVYKIITGECVQVDLPGGEDWL